MSMFANSTGFHGVIRREIAGRKFELDVLLCCPGDWPDFKRKLPDAAGWSTQRLGTAELAVGPPVETAWRPGKPRGPRKARSPYVVNRRSPRRATAAASSNDCLTVSLNREQLHRIRWALRIYEFDAKRRIKLARKLMGPRSKSEHKLREVLHEIRSTQRHIKAGK